MPRFYAFLRKEMLQVWRDPSSILVALVLPLLMMFLFGYGVSLDVNTLKIGVVLEDAAPEALSLAYAFERSRYFSAVLATDRHRVQEDMVAARLRGVVVIPQDFSRKLRAGEEAQVQVLADGAEANTANFVQFYAQGTLADWLAARAREQGKEAAPPVSAEPRVWFNTGLKSRDALLPGSISVIMAMIGTLLTAMVIAREWERGTMEAMMATPIRIHEMIIAKMVPYFLLGLGSMLLCVVLSVFLFGVPFRGSMAALLLSGSVFLLASLGQGLLISTSARSQFVAIQVATMASFLPAFILSGFLFEIHSMPLPLRLLADALPPRYFVAILQTVFLTGDVWALFLPNLLAMLAIAAVLLVLTARRSVKRLD
ncbi:MAG: ABC transporter permease [Alphaproteobacteria bacterium]|nr:ABC transporter permease [Alphaproteobacteria bacterium]